MESKDVKIDTKYFLLVLVLVCGVLAQEEQNEVEEDGNWKVIYRVVSDCARKSDMGVCLKMKAVVFLDRALSTDAPLFINDYISLAKEQKVHQGRSMKQPLSESKLEEILPKSHEEKNVKLDDMLQEKVDTFLHSRSLQVDFPSDVFEGRRRNGKKGGYLLAGALALAGMAAQAVMGKIALIAGKALLVAKIALVISSIVGLKKLLGGGGGGGGGGHEVVYATGGHEHGWQRSFSDDHIDSHDLAYNSQKPNNSSED